MSVNEPAGLLVCLYEKFEIISHDFQIKKE
nr:MAG TPA: hypothetical protein [Caudoviricetes sp.]